MPNTVHRSNGLPKGDIAKFVKILTRSRNPRMRAAEFVNRYLDTSLEQRAREIGNRALRARLHAELGKHALSNRHVEDAARATTPLRSVKRRVPSLVGGSPGATSAASRAVGRRLRTVDPDKRSRTSRAASTGRRNDV